MTLLTAALVRVAPFPAPFQHHRWRVYDARGMSWTVTAPDELAARLQVARVIVWGRKDAGPALLEWAASNLTARERG